MAKYSKDVLYPGTYSVPDATGRQRRTVRYTPEDVRRLRERFGEMKSAGVAVPVCWGHQDDARPMTAAERAAAQAKGTLGWVEELDVSPEGYLVATIDVPSDDDARRLPAVRYVSPEILPDFTDGDGRRWPGRSITHVAVTSRPVQHRQQPFRPLQPDLVRLSLADRLGEADMADNADKPEQGEGGGEGPPLKKVLEKLAGHGIKLPDDTDEANFLERLIVALEALGGQEGGDEPEPPPDVGAAEPVAMSLERRLKAAEARLLITERDNLKRRIQALYDTGRVTRPIRDKLLSQAGAVQLSLSESGSVAASPLVARVEAYEDLLPNTAWSAERLDLARPVPPPAPDRRPQTAQEVDDIVSGWDKALGR